MGSDDAMVDERLSVFDDEPDLNDWFEVICGSLMAVIGNIPTNFSGQSS